MKKNLLPLFVISILVLFLLSACNSEHIHDFSEWSVSVEAGCKTDGKRIRSCSCGEMESESVPAIGHSYADGICTNCNADEPSPAEYFIFTELEDGTYSVKAADPNTISGKIVIPAEYNGKPVTKVAAVGFYKCNNITEIIISNGVASINNSAFIYCASLERLSIPDSVTHIGSEAFAFCTSLKNLSLGSGVNTIEWQAFYRCEELESLVIPNSVENIGHHAFYGCYNLANITIGSRLLKIPTSCFERCYALETIVIGASVQEIQTAAFKHCTSLSFIDIPDGVTVLEFNIFFGCNSLKDVILGNGVEKMSSAFNDTPGLENIYYVGTRSDWDEIVFNPYPDLVDVNIHYNYSREK